jgi:protein-L-isoaspartate(D-aspartate) O-methyltransferase
MTDFAGQREMMVKEQLIPRGISDRRVLEAMEKVPREHFMPEAVQQFAYDDGPLPIGEDQTISQPYVVAFMTELLELKGDETILEIGTGGGYQTAILCELAKKVYSIERFASLARQAEQNLNSLGYQNFEIKVADGSIGWKEVSPFDAIMVTAACPEVPKQLFEQLKENGRLVLPLGDRYLQTMTRIRKIQGRQQIEEFFACQFVPLVGKYGWK